MTHEPGRRPTRGQIVLLAALSAFGPLSLDMYLPGLPAMTRDLHTTASAAQLTITACMIGLGGGAACSWSWRRSGCR